jgi:hypothetical protein
MKIKYTILILGALVLITSFANARSVTTPPQAHRIWDKKWLDINRWRCPFYNDGRYAYDEATTNAGGSWPYPLNNYYIFGAGPWVGAIVRGDTYVTVGYNPNTARGEFYPTPAFDWGAGTGNAYDRVYKFPSDWPPPASRFGTDSTLVPRKNFSLQDMWCVYCDLSQDYHVSGGRPLGIEIYQTVYAWNYPTNQDIFFITYKVKNVNATDTIKNMIIGACMDPDIGESGYQVPEEGDMIGLIKKKFIDGDTIRDVGFCGDANNIETNPQYWQSGTPGVVAYKFLEGARDIYGNPLGMTGFKKFTIDIDPNRDVDQYLTMAGFDYRTGVYNPFDSIDEVAADKRFIQCTGPITLPPNGVTTILVACIAAPYGDWGELWAQRDTNDLKPLCRAAVAAQYVYDQDWLLPGPPVASNAILIPQDHAIRIVWDNLSEISPDPYYEVASDTTSSGYDPLYHEYDFEGYKIYKSSDGLNYTLLGQCDLNNGIRFIIKGDSLISDTARLRDPGATTIANDAGVYYSLNDNNVTNGFTYYYRVASYDYNFTTGQTGVDTLSFENNPPPVSARPRWEAPNYAATSVMLTRIVGNSTNPGLRCSTRIVTPFEITRDTFTLTFAGPVYDGAPTRALYRFTVKSGDSLVMDTVRYTYTVGTNQTRNYPPFDGAEIIATSQITVPTKTFDTIYPLTGNYSPERLTISTVVPWQYATWAFRGSDYKIVWRVVGTNRTCEVYDMTNNGVLVPRTRFRSVTGNDSLANGWGITTAFTVACDTLLTSTAKYMYINCGYISLNRGSAVGALIDSVADGDEWFVKGYTGFRTAPYYNVFQMTGNPPDQITDSTYTLNVKVVPNPYIIKNRWETNKFERKIAFTHLPATCKIRIFTMAGHLVKVIEHTDHDTQPMDKGGTELWDLLNEHEQLIASGVYIFHIESDIGEQIGKFAVVQ